MSTVIAGNESGTSLTPFFHETLQRLGRQSANCKLGASLGLVMVLVLALQSGNPNILWSAAPLALLALADAGYAAQARRMAEFGRRLNGQKDSLKPGDLLQVQASAWGFQGALGGLAGFLSFTVWPFYLCLAGLAIGLGNTVVVPMVKVAPTVGPRSPGYPQPTIAYPSQLPGNAARSSRPFPMSSGPGATPQNVSRVPVRPGLLPNTMTPGSPGTGPKMVPAPVPRTSPGAAATVPPAAPTPPPAASPTSSAAPPPSPTAGQTK